MDHLEQVVGSLIIAGFQHTTHPDSFIRAAENGRLGGIILFRRNYYTLETIQKLIHKLQEVSHYPLFIAVDQEGGKVVRFEGDFPTYPSPSYFGSRDDAEGYINAVRHTSEWLRKTGINLNLVPVCDLQPEDRSHVIHYRSFSSDPMTLSIANREVINVMREAGVLSCAKHFPGLRSAIGDPHFQHSNSQQTLEQFRNKDYIPFKAAIDEQVDMVMVTHVHVPAIDPENISTFSEKVIESELRDHLCFDGLVIADDLQMAAASQDLSPIESGVKALMAGCDLLIYGDLSEDIESVIDGIACEAKSNPTLADRIAKSCKKVTHFKETNGDYF